MGSKARMRVDMGRYSYTWWIMLYCDLVWFEISGEKFLMSIRGVMKDGKRG